MNAPGDHTTMKLTTAGDWLPDQVMSWRKGERERLLAMRMALTPHDRKRKAAAMEGHLERSLGSLEGRRIGLYWPIKGEPNLRRWMERLHALGACCALPVIERRAAPLVFRAWWPGALMIHGTWAIPEPAEGHTLQPDLVIAPMVGFDERGYRLGYGGGYYDRTLASMTPRPTVVGVAYAQSAMPTIRPLAHDIPMDCVVTECGVARLVAHGPT